MTNELSVEEAVELLKEKRMEINYQVNGTTRFSKALEMAIKTLEQQPSDDCVSREEAINVVHKYFADYLKLNDDICLDGIRSLPPVTPSRPKGHWIEHPHECGDNWQYPKYECSKCHIWVEYDDDFCPGCGADMTEGEEE